MKAGRLLTAGELKALGVVKTEVKEVSVLKYEVGVVKDLKNISIEGDKLDVHHIPQSKPASQLIKNYDPKSAPGIILPAEEHRFIPVMKGNQTAGTARQQLAKDVKDLRKYTNTPNSKILQVVELAKKLYPELKKN